MSMVWRGKKFFSRLVFTDFPEHLVGNAISQTVLAYNKLFASMQQFPTEFQWMREKAGLREGWTERRLD